MGSLFSFRFHLIFVFMFLTSEQPVSATSICEDLFTSAPRWQGIDNHEQFINALRQMGFTYSFYHIADGDPVKTQIYVFEDVNGRFITIDAPSPGPTRLGQILVTSDDWNLVNTDYREILSRVSELPPGKEYEFKKYLKLNKLKWDVGQRGGSALNNIGKLHRILISLGFTLQNQGRYRVQFNSHSVWKSVRSYLNIRTGQRITFPLENNSGINDKGKVMEEGFDRFVRHLYNSLYDGNNLGDEIYEKGII